MNVLQRLSAAREEFHAAKIKKTGHNNFAGYDYFELGDFIVPALAIFRKHGLMGVVSFGINEATLTVSNIEQPEDRIVITSPMSSAALKGCHEVQNLGAVQTYLRRYLWVAALEIVEHDALDATTGKKGDAPIVTPRGNIGDDLPEDQKQFLADLAIQCTDLVKEGKPREAWEAIEQQNLEADQQVWLANQMDSKTRAAIKAAKNIPR